MDAIRINFALASQPQRYFLLMDFPTDCQHRFRKKKEKLKTFPHLC